MKFFRRIRDYLDRSHATRNGWKQTLGEYHWTKNGDEVLYLSGEWCLAQGSKGHHIPMPEKSFRAAIDRAEKL